MQQKLQCTEFLGLMGHYQSVQINAVSGPTLNKSKH